MVSHYLAGGRETTRGASTQPVLLRGHKGCGLHNSWSERVEAGGRERGGEEDRMRSEARNGQGKKVRETTGV